MSYEKQVGILPTWSLLDGARSAAPAKTAAQQSLESVYSNKETVKKYEATESVMKPKIVSESHKALTPTRSESSKKGPAHTYEAGESFMKYSAVISKLSPSHFGKFVQLAMHDEKAAANWLHSIGDSLDSAGEGIYNAGAAVNRGARNVGNSAYNLGQSVMRIPGQMWAGVTGGLGDRADVMGSGDYGKGPPKPPAPTGVTRPTGGAYTPPQPVTFMPPRPAASPAAAAPRPAAPPAAAAPRPAAPPAAPPAGAPPQPAGGLPRQIPQPAMLKVPPQPAAPAPRADSTTAARPPQRAPGWNFRPGQK